MPSSLSGSTDFNVPNAYLSLAGFEVTIIGRFWVTAEAFLEFDGVPWNNNNAEHAIKAFARLRNVISGTSTKKGIEEYLTLLSIAETCEYRRIDSLDFLRSGSKDVHEFANV